MKQKIIIGKIKESIEELIKFEFKEAEAYCLLHGDYIPKQKVRSCYTHESRIIKKCKNLYWDLSPYKAQGNGI